MNVGLPERFEVDEHSGDLRIHWKWPVFMALPLAFFSLAWDGFLVFCRRSANHRRRSRWNSAAL